MWVQAECFFTVADFHLLEGDQTANREGTEQYDKNGNRCAVIRIATTDKDFAFEAGTIGIVGTDYNQVGEIWVYVPPRIQRMTIKHPKLGILDNYYFPCSIESAHTYRMDIALGSVEVDDRVVYSQYVEFKVVPAHAVVIIDDAITLVPDAEGIAFKSLPLGQHTYSVECQQYQSQTGIFQLTAQNKLQQEVTLVPNFGWFVLTGDVLRDAAIVLDGNRSLGKITQIPFVSDKIRNGKHQLRIIKDLYEDYTQNIEIKANDTLRLTPELKSNYGGVHLVVENNAEIWIDGVKKGEGRLPIKLAAGTYQCVTKLPHHRDSYTTIHIHSGMSGDINLNAPIPITTSLSIESSPTRATVFLDNQEIGITPLQLNSVLVGDHTLRFQKEGYLSSTENITLEENHPRLVQSTLLSTCSVRLKAREEVSIYIKGPQDNEYQYKTFGTIWEGTLMVGRYSVRTSRTGCDDGYTEFTVSSSFVEQVLVMPTEKSGTLIVKSRPSGANVFVDNLRVGMTPYTGSASIGSHNLWVTKSGYVNSAKQQVTVRDKQTTTQDFNLKRDRPYVYDYHPDHYLETFYGFGVSDSRLENTHYIGLNYSWIPRYVGLNISTMYGISTHDFSLTAGPAFRLLPVNKDVSLQLMLGTGGVYSSRSAVETWSKRLDWIVDAGFRIGFTPEDAFAWWSINLGCKYYDHRFVPNVGISLMPLRLLVLAAEADEYPIKHFVEFLIGGLVGHRGGVMFGATYSYLPAHLGFFLSGMGGTRECASISAGLAFRLLPEDVSNVFDWHIYVGPGWGMYNGNHNAIGDVGMRFAFNTHKSSFCAWSFSGGVQFADGYVAPYGGVSLAIVLVVGTAGVGTLMVL